jgi:hypothetical protein
MIACLHGNGPENDSWYSTYLTLGTEFIFNFGASL